jgi:molybdopterin converting factor small subunit
VEVPAAPVLGLDGAAGAEVTVLFFAGAREATGTRRAAFRAPSVALLIEQLRSAYGPELEALLPTCAIWVNGSAAAPDATFHDGDEVAVLPPVSGGCGNPRETWPPDER